MARLPGKARLWALFAVLAPLLTEAACGSGPAVRQGKLEELYAEAQPGEAAALAARSLKVEKIATQLEVQKDEYRIGPNDILNILVLEHEELSSVRDFNRGIVGTVVKKDGNIYLPIVGPLRAAGYTVEEFHEVLRSDLAKFVKNPQLSVDVLRYESQKFFVLGEVRKPGAFPVDGDTTLLEAIGLAEGVTLEGSLENAYVVRGETLLPISLADLLLRGDTRRNVYMRDRDLVYVPSARNQKVYVLGEVHQPGAFQMPQGQLTLAQALAEAGGIVEVNAKRRAIKLIRGTWQEPVVYTFSYKFALVDGEQIALRPGDRIFVEPSGLTTASRYMQQLLPFLLGSESAAGLTESSFRIHDRVSQ